MAWKDKLTTTGGQFQDFEQALNSLRQRIDQAPEAHRARLLDMAQSIEEQHHRLTQRAGGCDSGRRNV